VPRRRLAVAIPQARLNAFAELREAVEGLAPETRRAMLAGIRNQKIVAGAFTDNRGGACPMLAAHRAGSRTPALEFADAWDSFTGTKAPWYRRACKARPATDEELYALASLLERSIRHDPAPPAPAASAASDPAPPAEAPEPRAGDPARARELRDRCGWAWLRPVRDYDSLLRMIRLAEEAARERRPLQALSSAASRSARLRQ
jgi:hypothetical protein